MKHARVWMFAATLAGLSAQGADFTAASPAPAASPASEPDNLARRAKVTASSEHDASYSARFAVDGVVPEEEGRDDAGRAWCVNGAKDARTGEFTLEWPEAVTVSEIVYYGRTGWIVTDMFKEYEVYVGPDLGQAAVDGRPQQAEALRLAARGTFELRHGPQRIPVTPTTTQTVRLKFLSAHGGPNPGASEIAVYASRPSDAQIGTPAESPLTALAKNGSLGFRELVVVKRNHLSTSHVYTYHAEGFRPGGALCVFTPETGSVRELVNAGEGMIIDCDLSYDGREVLFSWKRGGKPIASLAHQREQHCTAVPGENFQVFRVNVDGTGLKQLTGHPSNNLNPCWLPDGGIAFISDRKPGYAYCFVSTSPVLHRMNRDGGEVTQLTASYLMDFTPAALEDGRILYTRWEYVDRPAIPIQSLWAIRPDGTGLSGFFGNRVLDPGTFMQARPIPGTGKVLCLLTAHNGDPRGAIGIIDPARGGNAQEAIHNLTPEISIGRVDHGNGNHLSNKGSYETPYPVDARHYLVSRSGSIQLRAFEGDAPPATLLRKGADGLGYYSPTPVMARTRPPVLPATPVPADAAPWATVFMSDVYNGLEPAVKRGEIKQVCVVEEVVKDHYAPLIHEGVPGAHGYAANTAFGYQFPLVSCGATYAPKKIWGYADVAEDGSARFQVPAGLPVYFLALDAEGRAVQRMRTFTHFMTGEVQSCVGCHADRNYSTPALAHSKAVGPDLGQAALGGLHAARLQQAEALQPPDWGVKAFNYLEVVQPVLDRHCVECHHARDPAGGVDLAGDLTDFFNVSYDVLARKGTWGERNPGAHGIAAAKEGRSPYTSWIATINGTEHNILKTEPRAWGSPASPLADLVISGHPDKSGKPRVNVPEADRRRIMAWIDLNVPYYPTSSSDNLEAMGCRRVFPVELDAKLAQVAATRCVACHDHGVPREFYIRIEKPELNTFLLAPLAKSAGGTERCGTVVFKTPDDSDYQALLGTFDAVAEHLRTTPRDDRGTMETTLITPPLKP